MIDLIRKTMLAGLGATIVTKEAVEKQLQALVEKGKITSEEARKTAEDITEHGRQEFEKVKMESEQFVAALMQKGTLVTRSQWDELEARVSALEKGLSQGPSSE